MELIIEYYQGLDTLNLIIFWGIIIVIILLLILSLILINKNKKLKKIVDDSKKEREEEVLPIKKIETEITEKMNINETEFNNKPINETEYSNQKKTDEINHIETERMFVAEEHIKKYSEDTFLVSDAKKREEELQKENNKIANNKYILKGIEIPTKPYQRNVLREMSLSQTSPIGITRQINKEDKKIELAKDLENSLNEQETKKEIIRERNNMQNEIIKKELSQIDDMKPRKTEIIQEEKKLESKEINSTIENNQMSEKKEMTEKKYNQKNPYFTKFEELNNQTNQKIQNKLDIQEEKYNEYIPPQVKELLETATLSGVEKNIKSSSELYLEEVSKKLSEAETHDEIERTDYELEQEENAIISYKELMEKKDSIQTIDEEEAIISIEELMNKNSNDTYKQVESDEETKLYNLTEEEENDNFLKELKQFRDDL